jgi:hypothetical protein
MWGQAVKADHSRGWWAMKIRIPLRLWLFTTMVLLLMLMALVYSYPGGWSEVAKLSEQVAALIEGK